MKQVLISRKIMNVFIGELKVSKKENQIATD